MRAASATGPFWISIKTDRLDLKLDTLAARASDLEKPLAHFGAYLRRKAIAKYAAQAFAPLAQSTLQKRFMRGVHSLEGKLASDLKKARRRAAEGSSDAFQGAIVAANSRGVANRLAVLGEFQKFSRMHRSRRGGIVVEAAQLKPLTLKQNMSLSARTQRSIDRAMSKPVLGNLPRSVVFDVGSGKVTLKSQTYGKWSAAHNDGATVGHGAQLPQRETIAVDDSDLDVLRSILKSHLLLPLESGDLQGPGF